MNVRKFYIGKAIGFIILLLVVGIIAGFYAFNSYIYQQKQGMGNNYEPYRATLIGEYVCLPHIDSTGPQTTECAAGLKTDAGEYYALDFNLMSQSQQNLATGDKISANGVITPAERLSSNSWQKYPIEGIFSVTDSLNIIK